MKDELYVISMVTASVLVFVTVLFLILSGIANFGKMYQCHRHGEMVNKEVIWKHYLGCYAVEDTSHTQLYPY